jgi:hypothetical protein
MGCSTYMVQLGSPATVEEEGWRRMTMERQWTHERSSVVLPRSSVTSALSLAANRTACIPLAEPRAVTVDVREGRSPAPSRMPRPMTILAGEGQPGQQVSPIRKQTSPLG